MSLKKNKEVNRNRNESNKYQHVSDVIGSWGPLQISLMTMLTILYIPGPFNNMGIVLYTIKSPFWCSENKTLEKSDTPFQCKTQRWNESCHEWTFNDTRKTIITEWDLVCDRRWLVSLTLAAYQIGYLFSGPFFGLFSDTYGRKKALILGVVLEILSTISSVISVTIYQFIVARFFMGIAGYARYLSSLLLPESVGPKIRAKTIAGYDISYFVIKFLSTIVAYYVENFRTYFLLVAILEATFLLWIYKVPESPLWQLINDKYEPAKETILKYSKKRGEDESQVIMKLDGLCRFLTSRKNDEMHSKKPSILKILKHWILFKLVVILCFIWFVAAYINYGISYALRDLTGNLYINFLVICVADFISNLVLWMCVEKIKRRTILGLCQLATGIMFLCMTGFVSSNEYLIFQTVFIMIGKFFAGIIFVMVYVYTPEIFPTSVRQFGVGLCSIISRLASISSAFVPELVQMTSIELVFILFGTMALIGAGLTYFLFETKGKEMPNTVEEMIDLQK